MSPTTSTRNFLLLACVFFCIILALSNVAQCASIPSEYFNEMKQKPHTVNLKTPAQLQKALSHQNYLLFFTVNEALKAQCPYCHVFKDEYEKLATQYWNQGHRNQVFFVVEYQQNMMSLIQGIGLRQVPALHNIKTKANCDISSKRLQDCIKEWTGVKSLNVASKMSPQQMPQQQQQQNSQQAAQAAHQSALSIRTVLYLFALAGIAMAIYATRKIGFLPTFLTTAAWCVYLASLGGIVYNWINNPPPFQMGQNGVAFFYPSHMQQLSMEGYISGTMMLLNAVSFLALGEFVPSVKSAMWRRLLSCALIATWVGSTIMVVGFFLMKNSWYMSGTPFSPYLQIIKALMSRGG